MRRTDQLEYLEPVSTMEAPGGSVTLSFALPTPAGSLIEIIPVLTSTICAVATVAQIFAIIAGLVHFAAFIFESVVFHRPGAQRFLAGRTETSPAVRLWAFNQGFYNLFLGAGAIIGAIMWMSGAETAGRTLVIYTAAFMALCGVVLFVSDRTLWRGMIGQTTPPLVALVATLAA